MGWVTDEELEGICSCVEADAVDAIEAPSSFDAVGTAARGGDI